MGQLDQQRERVQDDLRGLIDGDIRCDDVFLQLYSSDASIYEIRPLGVVRPASTEDVVACVQYAAEKLIPIHARGAGTGLAGEALGPGLVLDFSKYMRREIRTDEETIRVQPGVVCERLNAHLKQHGRLFGPDPIISSVATIGGMIGVDAAGSRWLKYGSVRHHVLGMRIVLADGQVMDVAREPIEQPRSRHDDPRKRQLVEQLAHLLTARADLIQKKQPSRWPNWSGYNLSDVISDGHLDLPKLLTGSEGTLALVTEAVIATQPIPQHRGVCLFLFDSLDKAAHAVQAILPYDPTACDLMDRRHLSLASESDDCFDRILPVETEGALLVELEADDPFELQDHLRDLVDEIQRQKELAFAARRTVDPAEARLFWRLARQVTPALYRLKGSTRPIPVVEDIAIPPESLPSFLPRIHNVLKQHQVTASIFSHAGRAVMHLHPFLDLADPADVRKIPRLADDLYEQALDVGGSIGGEHACGLSRTPFLQRQYGELVDVFREVKRIFDPRGTLNPGKIVGDDPNLFMRNLRSPVIASSETMPQSDEGERDSGELRDLTELQLNWDAAYLVNAADECNGCGKCRTQASDARMCPLFRIAPAEEASPRAKANLIRGVLSGRLDLASLTDDEFRDVSELCIHCHMCRLECPAEVDIPKLMVQGKGAYVAANGLSFGDWIMTRLDVLAALASLISPVANWSIRNRQMRWLMEKGLGIAQGRKLPRVSSRSFLRRAARRRWTRPPRGPGPKVAYFVDTFANYHDPQLGTATVAVMQHNGIEVFVPPEQKQSATAAIACGALDAARRLAQHNVTILAEAVRQGYHIVASEPAAVLCLVREYVELLDDDDARLVAENTSEACQYLWNLHAEGKLKLDLNPINVQLAYHMPCRLKALEIGTPGMNLLELVPGLSVRHCEEGCSGMAGTFGLAARHYRASLRIGWPLISRLRDPIFQAGTTECSACKMQMEQGTTKPTVHPIKLLALSYGLMPRLVKMLTKPGEELVIT